MAIGDSAWAVDSMPYVLSHDIFSNFVYFLHWSHGTPYLLHWARFLQNLLHLIYTVLLIHNILTEKLVKSHESRDALLVLQIKLLRAYR